MDTTTHDIMIINPNPSVVWKYELNSGKNIFIPDGFTFLSMQSQHNVPCMWVAVCPDNIKSEYKPHMYGTGQAIVSPLNKKYIGTFQEAGGALAWHVFLEKIEPIIAPNVQVSDTTDAK